MGHSYIVRECFILQSASGITGSCPLLNPLPAFECYINLTVNLCIFSFKNLTTFFSFKTLHMMTS